VKIKVNRKHIQRCLQKKCNTTQWTE